MLIPGSVKAGDELIYEFGNRVKQRKIVKVRRITTENDATMGPSGKIYRADIIILEDNNRFRSDGTPIGYSAYNAELHPLEWTDFLLKETDIDKFHVAVWLWYTENVQSLHILITTENQTKEFLEYEIPTPVTLVDLPAPRIIGENRDNRENLMGEIFRLVREMNQEEIFRGHLAILHQ